MVILDIISHVQLRYMLSCYPNSLSSPHSPALSSIITCTEDGCSELLITSVSFHIHYLDINKNNINMTLGINTLSLFRAYVRENLFKKYLSPQMLKSVTKFVNKFSANGLLWELKVLRPSRKFLFVWKRIIAKSSSETFPELLESSHGHSSAFHLVLFFKLRLDYHLSFLQNPPSPIQFHASALHFTYPTNPHLLHFSNLTIVMKALRKHMLHFTIRFSSLP